MIMLSPRDREAARRIKGGIHFQSGLFPSRKFREDLQTAKQARPPVSVMSKFAMPPVRPLFTVPASMPPVLPP